MRQEMKIYKKRQEIIENKSLDSINKKNALKSIPKLKNTNPITNMSIWWGNDNWKIDNFHANDPADITTGQIIGFKKEFISVYPTFKNPTIDFDTGKMLCKLGFPFYQVVPKFHTKNDSFEFPSGTFPMPLFPIEGIFTRNVNVQLPPQQKTIANL